GGAPSDSVAASSSLASDLAQSYSSLASPVADDGTSLSPETQKKSNVMKRSPSADWRTPVAKSQSTKISKLLKAKSDATGAPMSTEESRLDEEDRLAMIEEASEEEEKDEKDKEEEKDEVKAKEAEKKTDKKFEIVVKRATVDDASQAPLRRV